MPNINAPEIKNKGDIIIPDNMKPINKNVYYLINSPNMIIYDENLNYYGISNGYSLRPTYKTDGCISITNSNKDYWIKGNVKYIINNNIYILNNIIII